jgi:N-terminal domain on NACHT_NTPase and P-loop NTPases
MAEALAAVGVAASIVQLVDFSSKILHRLDEFRSSVGEVPKSFRHIRAELPVLQDSLRQIKEAIDAGSVEDRTKKTLMPAIQGCQDQIEQLDAVLAKTLPESSTAGGQEAKRCF